MKLYLSAGASSQAPHIAFREIGIDIVLISVDLRSHVTSDGDDFTSLNPFGYVPLLEFNDGATLREAVAILLYAAELNPDAALAPMPGTLARFRLFEWLNFLSSEMHPSLRSLVGASSMAEVNRAQSRLEKHFAWINVQLSAKPYLLGQDYSIADIYLWVMSNWIQTVATDGSFRPSADLNGFESIHRWHESIAKRDAVKAAVDFERRLIRPIPRQ
jgi:glutathione S-transferase